MEEHRMPEALFSAPVMMDGSKAELSLSPTGIAFSQGVIPWNRIVSIDSGLKHVTVFHNENGAQKQLQLKPVSGGIRLVLLREEIRYYWQASRIDAAAKNPEAPPVLGADASKSPAERVGLLAVLFKLGPKLFGILTKFGATGPKIGLAAATFTELSFLYSWEFAVLLMGMLFIHEYGHVFAMKRSGMKVKGIYYIPFLGAVAVSDSSWPTRRAQAYVALNGPLWGAILSTLALIGYFATGRHHPTLGVVAAWWAVINLFNLIPMNPLDGGRLLSAVTGSIHKTVGMVIVGICMALAILLAFLLKLHLIWFLALIGLFEMWNRHKGRRASVTYQSFLQDLETSGTEITPFNSRELMSRLGKKLGLSTFKQGVLRQALAGRHKKLLKSEATPESPKTTFESVASQVLHVKSAGVASIPEMSTGQIAFYSSYYVGLALLLCVVIIIGSIVGQHAGKAAFGLLR
jgi:Zn-dependent protease